nr:hypothetical protein [uncultured Desulfobacter sp.]
MKIRKWFKRPALFVLLISLIAGQAPAADDFFLYGNQGEQNITHAAAPVVGGSTGAQSWFTAVAYFTAGPNEGRMLAATGTQVFISSGSGESVQWTRVAEVDSLGTISE